MADLIRYEPMHPEEARRIVGECASALEAARQRGLHHLCLGPRNVLRLSDGSIAVTQVAVTAALNGRDDLTGAEASKVDTQALVELLYLGLTGLWAGSADVELPGIERAQRRVDGQLPTPAELVDRIPTDLDTMCRQTLNLGKGPSTPGEVARQLSPWSAQAITAPGRRRRDAEEVAESKPEQTYTVRRANIATDDDQTPAPQRKNGRAVGAVGAAALAAAGASKLGKEGTSSSDWDKDNTDPGIKPAFASGSRAAALPKRPAPADSDATMVGRPGQFDADETTQFTLDDENAAYSRTNYDPSFEELEPPVPGFQAGTDDPDASSSKLALGIVALCVLAALLLAVWGLMGLTGSHSSPAAANSSQAAAAPKSSAKPSSSSSSAASGTPVQLTGARIITSDGTHVNEDDPSGAIDGDSSTAWTSRFYIGGPWGHYPNFGGMQVNLPGETAVKTIKITPGKNEPLTADVYVGDQPGTSGTKVGSFSNVTDTQTVQANGAKGQFVTIFITNMAQLPGQQYYQASISEVQVLK